MVTRYAMCVDIHVEYSDKKSRIEYTCTCVQCMCTIYMYEIGRHKYDK